MAKLLHQHYHMHGCGVCGCVCQSVFCPTIIKVRWMLFKKKLIVLKGTIFHIHSVIAWLRHDGSNDFTRCFFHRNVISWFRRNFMCLQDQWVLPNYYGPLKTYVSLNTIYVICPSRSSYLHQILCFTIIDSFNSLRLFEDNTIVNLKKRRPLAVHVTVQYIHKKPT